MQVALTMSAPQSDAERAEMIRAGLLTASGQPVPVFVDLDINGNGSGGVFAQGGQRLLTPISPEDVHESAEIPNVLHGWRNGMYRADSAATIHPVDYRKDKWRKHALANTFLRRNTQVAHDAAVPEIDVGTSLEEYTVNDYAIGSFVSLVTEGNEGSATAFRSRAASAKMCANAIMLDREYRFWVTMTTAGSWNASNVITIVAGTKWNGGATADVLQNLRDIMAASMADCTDIWLNSTVAGYLLKDAGFREHMRQMLGDGTPAPNVADLQTQMRVGTGYDFAVPGFPPFHVVTGKYTTTTSETATATALLENSVVFTRTLPRPPVSGEDTATIVTRRWKSPNGVGWQAREYAVEGRGVLGGRMLVAFLSEVDTFTSNRVGGLIKSAVQ